MNTNRWVGLLIAVIVVSLVTIIAINQNTSTSSKLRIGALAPLTGDNANYGTALQRGMNVALSEINEGGGVQNSSLEIIFEDTQADPQQGVSAFQKLIQVNDVSMIVGGMFSAVTLAAAPLAEKNETVLLSPTSSSVKLTKAGDYIFRIYPSDSFDGKFAAEFAYDSLDARTAAILNLQVSSTSAISDVFERRFTKLGGEIVLKEGHNEGASDFRTQLLKVEQTQPDIVFLPSYLNEMSRLLKQATELGIDVQFLSISTFNDSEILKLAGSAANGVIFSTPYFDPQSSDSLTSRFVRSFSNRYGSKPNIWAGYGYDAVRVAARALSMAGHPFSSDSIKSALYSIEDFEGVTGDVTFDRYGDVKKELKMMVVEDGRFVPYRRVQLHP